jgi:hypothetical protein
VVVIYARQRKNEFEIQQTRVKEDRGAYSRIFTVGKPGITAEGREYEDKKARLWSVQGSIFTCGSRGGHKVTEEQTYSVQCEGLSPTWHAAQALNKL